MASFSSDRCLSSHVQVLLGATIGRRELALHRAAVGTFCDGLAEPSRTDQADGMESDLPYVDQHAITIDAPRASVWTALQRYAAESIGAAKGGWLARAIAGLLGTEPRSGFAVAERESERRLALAGRHRFARYRLIFELDDGAPGATVLRASTYAIFPGVHGWLYRAMVIGTRVHVLATRGILHAIRRRSA